MVFGEFGLHESYKETFKYKLILKRNFTTLQ